MFLFFGLGVSKTYIVLAGGFIIIFGALLNISDAIRENAELKKEIEALKSQKNEAV